MLSEQKKRELLWQIDNYGDAQVDNASIAAFAKMTTAEFEEALKDPEVRQALEWSRNRGLGVLKEILWAKAVRDKNLNAIQFLAHHYLGMSKEDLKPKEKSLFIGELSTEKLQQMLSDLDG